MRRAIVRVAAAAALLAAVLAVATAGAVAQPKNSEQVVFSGVGSGNLGPFGFWIWCMAEASEASTGAYEGVCAGSMYFYELGIVRGVFGVVHEHVEGQYEMHVASTLDNAVNCTLLNEPPVTRGPTNGVGARCVLTPGGLFLGSSENAVVNVTGP